MIPVEECEEWEIGVVVKKRVRSKMDRNLSLISKKYILTLL